MKKTMKAYEPRALQRLWMGKTLLCLLAVIGLATSAAAQSTDPANPTPLTSGEIQGAGGEQKTVYYYTFEGGPGKVWATLEAKTKKGAKSASLGIELFDAQDKSLTSTLLDEGLGGGKEKLEQLIGKGLGHITSSLGSHTNETKEKTSRVKLKEKQTLTLRVTVGQGIETYAVKLEGAVEFGQPINEPAATEQPPTTPEQPPTQSEQTSVGDKKPAIKIPGKSTQENQKPPIVKIPGKKPQP